MFPISLGTVYDIAAGRHIGLNRIGGLKGLEWVVKWLKNQRAVFVKERSLAIPRPPRLDMISE